MEIKDKFETKNIQMLIFQGSWCPMCVSAMPQLAHFISDNGINEDRVEVINVNPFKTKPADKLKEYSVSRVPTVILLVNGKERERITEYAPSGWKQELESLVDSIKD